MPGLSSLIRIYFTRSESNFSVFRNSIDAEPLKKQENNKSPNDTISSKSLRLKFCRFTEGFICTSPRIKPVLDM